MTFRRLPHLLSGVSVRIALQVYGQLHIQRQRTTTIRTICNIDDEFCQACVSCVACLYSLVLVHPQWMGVFSIHVCSDPPMPGLRPFTASAPMYARIGIILVKS